MFVVILFVLKSLLCLTNTSYESTTIFTLFGKISDWGVGVCRNSSYLYSSS